METSDGEIALKKADEGVGFAKENVEKAGERIPQLPKSLLAKFKRWWKGDSAENLQNRFDSAVAKFEEAAARLEVQGAIKGLNLLQQTENLGFGHIQRVDKVTGNFKGEQIEICRLIDEDNSKSGPPEKIITWEGCKGAVDGKAVTEEKIRSLFGSTYEPLRERNQSLNGINSDLEHAMGNMNASKCFEAVLLPGPLTAEHVNVAG